MLKLRLLAFFLLLCLQTAAWALPPPPPLDLRHSFHLADQIGKPYFVLVSEPRGIKAAFDSDYATPFRMADVAQVRLAGENFEAGVCTKLLRTFNEGADGLNLLVNQMAGNVYTPGAFVPEIRRLMHAQGLYRNRSQSGLAPLIIAPVLAMASGAGTLVRLDRHNYFYNYGYLPGSDDREVLGKHVKSGRSFGSSHEHLSLDPSDVYYLDELEAYLRLTPDPSQFYITMMEILTRSDARGLSQLSPLGQTVMTDFLAIYTAELDRHLMSDLKSHPWENDLAEATFAALFIVRSGKSIQDKQWIHARPRDLFAIGNNGSGLGVTRKDRYRLQKLWVETVRKKYPDPIRELETLVGHTPSNRAGGDMIHGVMKFLNNPANQNAVRKHAEHLTHEFVAFLIQAGNEWESVLNP